MVPAAAVEVVVVAVVMIETLVEDIGSMLEGLMLGDMLMRRKSQNQRGRWRKEFLLGYVSNCCCFGLLLISFRI